MQVATAASPLTKTFSWKVTITGCIKFASKEAIPRAIPSVFRARARAVVGGLWVAMRVGFGDLTLWSFVMASAHGAGLMLVPFFLPSPAAGESHHHDTHQMHAWAFANFSAPSLLIASVVVHTLGYLVATALVAIVVYEKLGVAILRRAWFNIDLVWMLALMITGIFILFF